MDKKKENTQLRTTEKQASIEAVLQTITPRKVVLSTLVVVAVLFLFWLLVKFNLIAFGLIGAVVLSTAIRPAVNWLARWRIPRWIAATLIFLLIIAALVGIVWLMIPLVTSQGSQIMLTLNDYYAVVRESMVQSPSDIISHIAITLPRSLVNNPQLSGPTPDTGSIEQIGVAGQYGMRALRIVFILLMEILLTLTITIDRDSILLANLFFVPADKRARAREFIEDIEKVISDWVRGQALLCLSIAVLSLIAYLIIGLPNAIVLALFAGLMEAIPIIGPFLGAVPAVAVAMTMGQDTVIWVIVATLITQQLENHLLVPRIMKSSVGVSPVITLLAFVFFTSLFGLAGGLLAVPIAASAMLILQRIMDDANARASQEEVKGRDRLEVLRYESNELLADLRRYVRLKETPPEEVSEDIDNKLETLAGELDSILDETAGVMPAEAVS